MYEMRMYGFANDGAIGCPEHLVFGKPSRSEIIEALSQKGRWDDEILFGYEVITFHRDIFGKIPKTAGRLAVAAAVPEEIEHLPLEDMLARMHPLRDYRA